MVCCLALPFVCSLPSHLHGARSRDPCTSLNDTVSAERWLGAAAELSPQSRLRHRGHGSAHGDGVHQPPVPALGYH